MLAFAFVTDHDHADLTAGDQQIAEELRRRGNEVHPWVWDEARPDGCAFAVLRSAWDVWDRPGRADLFMRALRDAHADGVTVVNDLDTVDWAIDKRYLLDLSTHGVAVPDTVLVDHPASAGEIASERGWSRAVLKPRVGGSGWGVRLVEAGELVDDAPVSTRGWVVQEYLSRITDGELDLVLVDGVVTHAIRKTPRHGEFRTNWAFGATWEPCRPHPTAVAVAETVVGDVVPGRPLYARVDGVLDDDGFTVLEVEAVDPSLFVMLGPGDFVTRFADALEARFA